MINIGPKLTEIEASKVGKTRKTPGFPGHRWPRTVYDARGSRGAPTPPVPDFYLELFDRVVVRDLARTDGAAPDVWS